MSNFDPVRKATKLAIAGRYPEAAKAIEASSNIPVVIKRVSDSLGAKGAKGRSWVLPGLVDEIREGEYSVELRKAIDDLIENDFDARSFYVTELAVTGRYRKAAEVIEASSSIAVMLKRVSYSLGDKGRSWALPGLVDELRSGKSVELRKAIYDLIEKDVDACSFYVTELAVTGKYPEAAEVIEASSNIPVVLKRVFYSLGAKGRSWVLPGLVDEIREGEYSVELKEEIEAVIQEIVTAKGSQVLSAGEKGSSNFRIDFG